LLKKAALFTLRLTPDIGCTDKKLDISALKTGAKILNPWIDNNSREFNNQSPYR
jgi:hypothetical protein